MTHLGRRDTVTTVGLSIQVVCLYVGCYLSLPSVSVVEQLLFVVQQLLMGLCGVLKVWTLREGLREKYVLNNCNSKSIQMI